ncbi:HAD-IA family hydrolase [Marinomonas sp. C2222]|uniref:HAD-IA family hydrolase n=1 Tax=Marinomonas sargassi TaxID=2984494 RepID=A0ABT2YSD1_9GAMM|nr:HAD-IA family hydrolase [Marinomonas sargassi]MCV2402812.1 HAD-IA family hydrolase [Marinomonas sargassi]
MVKLVIFDWDGTLFDSIDKICQSMLHAGELSNAPKREKDDIKNIIGLSLDKAVSTVWPELSNEAQEEIIEHYKKLYVARDQVPPEAYANVITTLDSLKSKGIIMAVATGKTRRGLERVLDLTDTRNYFQSSRCADETLSKPDPLMLNELLSELAISPEDVVMVGDTEYDLNMAHNAGIRSVGVTYGAHESYRLEACRPYALINNFDELIDVLELKE